MYIFYMYLLLQKAPADSPLQTCLINSLNWAEDEPPVECDESFLPSLQERLSFSALQPISGNFTYFRVYMFEEAIQFELSNLTSQ